MIQVGVSGGRRELVDIRVNNPVNSVLTVVFRTSTGKVFSQSLHTCLTKFM